MQASSRRPDAAGSACRTGWDYFLPSLRDYVDSGHGTPIKLAPPQDKDLQP
ncbi:MAG TPA: hypothetical protein VIY28_11490 [Pseudonocardiaceae bacterium]